MNCRYCNGNVSVKDSSILYKQSYGLIHICDSCGAFVGCHKGTSNPLGTLANAELRELRKQAHEVFDSLWKTKRMSRGQAYKWLSKELNKPQELTHIGMFEIEDCRKVIGLKYPELGWNDKINFGKDRGKELRQLDKKYLKWLIDNTGLRVTRAVKEDL